MLAFGMHAIRSVVAGVCGVPGNKLPIESRRRSKAPLPEGDGDGRAIGLKPSRRPDGAPGLTGDTTRRQLTGSAILVVCGVDGLASSGCTATW